ncbi:TcpE family conjugal transfer membrane protein [Streptosporangium sp. NPDC087985]|uniref:TcpE family conjugal transfer membrane protein n=1 Tax=Streptosporangium sp. NPDC087985 TaxID=3366196 RepID=UPI00382AF28F
MDLPTYTNIWRIEKRLYKLYDLRLPMPLPIVWIGVFVGVVVPWSLLLYLLGLPLAAPWHVVYLVPPGIVTWLSTRPVIESKRLTELLQSQLRYVGEPRTWCRMAPTAEPSEINLTGRIWQAAPQQAAPVRVRSSRKARHAQSKRAVSSREVRPAVAAAAAAAAAAPVARGSVAWGAAPAPRRGTAPALGQAVAAGGAPEHVSAVPVERVSLAPPPAASTALVKALVDPIPAKPSAPVLPSGPESVPVASAEPEPASPEPASAESVPVASVPAESVPAVPAVPIDTEALRRLRRLAASAEAERAPAPARPAPPAAETQRSRTWPQERPAGTPAGVSIRAVPSGAEAKADPVAPTVAVPRSAQGETRVRRVESVVGRDSSGGWRRLAQVVIGPGSTSRTDGAEVDEARASAVFGGSRRVVVLGCTGGAGQTTTALMLGHTLARYREDRVLAVDAGVGIHALSNRIQGESPETLISLLTGLDNVRGYLGMRAYTSRCASGLEVIAGDSDSGAEQRLSDRTLFSDRRLSQTMDMLDRHYKLIVMDPAAALAARVLPYADQLVLVVPASQDGPDAVAMTYEWLDGHGCSDLRRRAIMVVNGVSRRSMGDVEQAEALARGRCRAIVRVPWEDELAPGRSERVEPSHLRAPGRRAYLALAGVVVAGFGAAQAVRSSEEELAQ